MLDVRVIPCLLLRETGLVKTVRFADPKYVGDPINAIRIFNEKEADELIFLDISATTSAKTPQFQLIGNIASECFMPLCYGGGLRTIDDIARVIALGVEKIAINAAAVDEPTLVEAAATRFGSQSVVVSMDAKRRSDGRYEVWTHGGTRATKLDPVDHARQMEGRGAGELLVNSIECDGTQAGYDLDLLHAVTSAVSVPVVACGGAGRLEHFAAAVRDGGASAVAAGSMFVFHGKRRAVLLSYPAPGALQRVFNP